MGVAIVENSKLVNSEHFLIKPTPNHYDSFNSFLHGLEDKHTRDKKTFKQQWKELQRYFNNKTLVAHNASFDCSVLRFTLDSAKLPYPDLEYHCTYRLSQELLPLRSFRLDDVSRHFKIKLRHHNAESDAKAAALILLRLCEMHKANSLEELSTTIGFKIGKIISQSNSYRPFSKR